MAAVGNQNPILNFIFPRNHGPRLFKPHKNPFDDQVLTPDEFRRRYRFSRDSLLELAQILKSQIEPLVATNKAYTAIERLCVVIRLLAAGAFQQINGDAEHSSQPSVSRHLRIVCRALKNLGKTLIQFNTDPAVLEATSNGFYAVKGR